jgi:hypothetical protein
VLPGPELHEILVSAAFAAQVARQRALESVLTEREVVTEATVDEVAASTVVEAVVDDLNVPRMRFEVHAVREQWRTVTAVTELAPADVDVARAGDLNGRTEVRPLSCHEDVVQRDVT